MRTPYPRYQRLLTSALATCMAISIGSYRANAQSALEFGIDAQPAPSDESTVAAFDLDKLVSIAVAQNPQLAGAGYAVEAARGRADQAGLYPNPTVGVNFDELGDRTGPGGVNTLPLVSQEIVTAGKLRLGREAGLREVDQQLWQRLVIRYDLLGEIRAAYFEAVALQTRIAILRDMVGLAENSTRQTQRLLEAQQVARLDLVQLEVESERLRAEFEAAERELPAVYKRLAAVVGTNDLAIDHVVGSLDAPLPEYEVERVRLIAVSRHPEVQSARAGVQKAQALVARATAEPFPNVNVDAGYVRQNQNDSDDFRLGGSVSVPLWNRNQGNIRAAEAEYCRAVKDVSRVENDVAERVALAMRDYQASRRRSERYRESILPRADETYRLSQAAYQGGEFEYLRVLEAQRALAQAHLEYVRSRGDAWRSAATISALALEDQWPPVEATQAPEVPPVISQP